MAFHRRAGNRFAGSIWPGFVDAITAMLMVMIFVLTIFMVVQFVLSETINDQDTELNALNARLNALSQALGLEQVRNSQLERRAATLGANLTAAEEEIAAQSLLIANLTAQAQAQTARIADFEAQVATLLAQNTELTEDRDAARAEIDRLLASGDLFRYTAPENAPVALLEREFAKLLGTKYALAVSSCSAALFLSLLGLGLKPGTKVLIPGFTFAAVPSAVIHANCRPVLVEVGQNYRIDLEDFAARLTDEVGAVIISHMRGHTSDMDAIMALCDAAGVPVVEDAAHSLGTLWNGRNIGTLGRVGCFSFQSYKLINSGEGGILVTDDADLVARAVIMSGAYEHNWACLLYTSDAADE